MGSSPEQVDAKTEDEKEGDAKCTEITVEEPADGDTNSEHPPLVIEPVNVQPTDQHAKRRSLFSYIGVQVGRRASAVSLFKRTVDERRSSQLDTIQDKCENKTEIDSDPADVSKLSEELSNDGKVTETGGEKHSESYLKEGNNLAREDANVVETVSSDRRSPSNALKDRPDGQAEMIVEITKTKFVSRYGRELAAATIESDKLADDSTGDGRHPGLLDSTEVSSDAHETASTDISMSTDVAESSSDLAWGRILRDGEEDTQQQDLYGGRLDTTLTGSISDNATFGDWDSDGESTSFMHDQGQQTSESSFDDGSDYRPRLRRRILVPTQNTLAEEQLRRAQFLEKAILKQSRTAEHLLQNTDTNARVKPRPKSSYVPQKEMTERGHVCSQRINIINVSDSIEQEPVYMPDRARERTHHGFHSIRPLARVIMALSRTTNAVKVPQFTSLSRQLEESKLVLSWSSDPGIPSTTRESRDVYSATSSRKKKQTTSERHVNHHAQRSGTFRRRRTRLVTSRQSSGHVTDTTPLKKILTIRPKSSPAPTRTHVQSVHSHRTSPQWDEIKNTTSARSRSAPTLTSREDARPSVSESRGGSGKARSDRSVREEAGASSHGHAHAVRPLLKQTDARVTILRTPSASPSGDLSRDADPFVQEHHSGSTRRHSLKQPGEQKHTPASSSTTTSPIVYVHTIPTSLGDSNETVMSSEFRARRIGSAASSSRRSASDSYTASRPTSAAPFTSVRHVSTSGATCVSTAVSVYGKTSDTAAEGSYNSTNVDTADGTAVGTHGSSAVGTHGSSAVGTHGSSAVGTRGNSAVGTHGSSAVGTHGSSAVGTRGSSAVGTHCSSSVGTRGSSAVGTRGSSAVGTRGSSAVGTHGSSAVGTYVKSAVGTYVSTAVSHKHETSTDKSSASDSESRTFRTASQYLLNLYFPKEKEYNPQCVRTPTVRRIPVVRTLTLRQTPVVRTPASKRNPLVRSLTLTQIPSC